MFNMLHSIPFRVFSISSVEYKNIQGINFFISLIMIVFRHTNLVFYLMIIVQLYFLVILVNFMM